MTIPLSFLVKDENTYEKYKELLNVIDSCDFELVPQYMHKIEQELNEIYNNNSEKIEEIVRVV